MVDRKHEHNTHQQINSSNTSSRQEVPTIIEFVDNSASSSKRSCGISGDIAHVVQNNATTEQSTTKLDAVPQRSQSPHIKMPTMPLQIDRQPVAISSQNLEPIIVASTTHAEPLQNSALSPTSIPIQSHTPLSQVDQSDSHMFSLEENGFEDQEGAGTGTRRVDSCHNGRFSMFNHLISHSKYRTIYQGVDNETGCEIAWSCYLLQKDDKFMQDELYKKLAKVKAITQEDHHDHRDRAKYILRVLHFEIRPTDKCQLTKFHERRHNSSIQHTKLNRSRISSRASNLNFSTTNSIIPHLYDDNTQYEELIVVTELTTTGSLKEFLRKIQHPMLKVIKEWCFKILEAVSFLHENGIIHGKITCESIYYNSNVAEIKVGDIGIKQIFAKAQIREDEQSLMLQEQASQKYDVLCIGMALLEMILTANTKHAFDFLCKAFNRKQKKEILDNLTNAELRDFVEQAINDDPAKRSTCEELLKHPFLVIKDKDKDVEVQQLHTLLPMIKESLNEKKRFKFPRSLNKVNESNLIHNATQVLAEENDTLHSSRRNQTASMSMQSSSPKKQPNMTAQSPSKLAEFQNGIQKIHTNGKNQTYSASTTPLTAALNPPHKQKVFIKRNKSAVPIKEEIKEQTGSSGNLATKRSSASYLKKAQEISNEEQKHDKQTEPDKQMPTTKSDPNHGLNDHTRRCKLLKADSGPNIQLSAPRSDCLTSFRFMNNMDKLESIKETGCDTSPAIKSISVQQKSDNIIQFVVEIKETEQSSQRVFTVTFPYDIEKDNVEVVVMEMKRDLNLNDFNIVMAKKKLAKAVNKFKAKRKQQLSKQNFEEVKVEDEQIKPTLINKFAQIGANALEGVKLIHRMQRQSSSMRDDAAPQTNQRKSDERFDENELPHSLMPEQFSDAPEIQVSLLDQYREVSQTSSSPRQQQELKLQRENMEERIQNVEVDSTNKENNAVIQYSNEAANPHNNTTGEMHDAMIREQQQNGPIGGRDVVANECFRNSLTYVDRELQSFVYNSNEKEQKNEKIQAEKERERDKSKQKQSRDEEIAFQQMVHAINEYTNILEVMFPNYAREYHEKNSHWQVPLEQSADLHQQSKSTNSPRHNTTNEVVLSLSFDEIDHRFDNFHPANEQTNPDRHAFDEHNLRDFDDFSIILFQDNENEFFNDFNAFEETLKARLMRQAKLNHVTQSYSTEQLGMSSLLLQSQEFTKERSSKQENRIPLQKSIKPNRSQKNLLQLQQPQTNLDKARLLKPVLQVSTDVAPNQLISIPQRIQLGVKQPELPQLRDSSSYVEESTAKDYIETFEDSKIASMVGSDALTNPLNEIKDIEYAKALQTDANQVNELAAQAALDILFAHFNESLSQPMQSEKLEAMFKKMRKKDIIKLRIALSIIHQSLGASPDESGSEVFSPYQFESITKVPGMSSSTLGSLFCRNTRRAVKKFKRNNGLSVDSVVDKETWVKIMQRAKDLLPVRIQEQAAADRGEPKKTQAHQMLPTLQAFCSEFDQHFKPSVKHNLHKRRSLIDFHLKLHKPALDGQEQAKQNPTPKFMQDFPDSQKHIEDITLMRRTSSEGQNQNMPLQTSPMLIGGTALDTNEESKQRPARFILKASSDIFFQQIDASPDQTSPLRFKQVSGRCSQNESDTDNKKKK